MQGKGEIRPAHPRGAAGDAGQEALPPGTRIAGDRQRPRHPDDIRDKMFYPLVSGREGGSGLGLTLAQSFVQQHQGTIECESRPRLHLLHDLLPLAKRIERVTLSTKCG
jgi:hypothetical protein